MGLTPEQKQAGRAFRAQCQQWLAQLSPGTARCTPYTAQFRHECKPGDRAVQSGTWAMALRQCYWLSPASGSVPAGFFAYVYRRGECARQCGLRVLSGEGILVLAEEFPFEKGAVVGEQPAHREVSADQERHARSS